MANFRLSIRVRTGQYDECNYTYQADSFEAADEIVNSRAIAAFSGLMVADVQIRFPDGDVFSSQVARRAGETISVKQVIQDDLLYSISLNCDTEYCKDILERIAIHSPYRYFYDSLSGNTYRVNSGISKGVFASILIAYHKERLTEGAESKTKSFEESFNKRFMFMKAVEVTGDDIGQHIPIPIALPGELDLKGLIA